MDNVRHEFITEQITRLAAEVNDPELLELVYNLLSRANIEQ